MRHSLVPSAALLILAFPAMVSGQSRPASRDTVPVGMLPPAGKCRIWMDGVPAAQQPAPTDCTTALRQRPANGTILYGPAQRETSGGRFDPSVGERTPGRTAKPGEPAESVERNGSAAEQELKRRREREERARRIQEMRERDERARKEATDRVNTAFNESQRRGAAAGGPANGPANSPTGRSAKPAAEPAAKPAAQPAKKKPE